MALRTTVASAASPVSPQYKWVALSNTTLGVLMATINSSIILISLPNIFTGLRVNPLVPANVGYLLWLMLGYLVVTAVLVVTLGRVGDMFGRVRMYNLGFAIFTAGSILLAATPMLGTTGALWLIVMRLVQGIGAAFLFANSSAIVTDVFPEDQRGLALGINVVAAIAGSFIGLVLGGLLGPVSWRLVFLVSVPVGLFGTVWAYLKLRDTGVRQPARIDWIGNLTFAVGLVALLIGITYGIMPYGTHTMGWVSPFVLSMLIGGVVVLALFVWVEMQVPEPMFRMPLFRIRAFTAGNVAQLLSSIGRGGMMFILIIWLQGIWLPQHGYAFSVTPLWAGIYMLPMVIGFIVSGPLSGFLADRYGARPFATGGMVIAAISFLLLEILPINFSYTWFALLLLMNGTGMGLFSAPNRTGVMNSLPPNQRGAGAGMMATFMNSSMVLSIGIFFTLIILGLSSTLPHTLYSGLTAQGIPAAAASRVAKLPPTSTVFAALLGYNPMQQLLGPVLHTMPHAKAVYLTGRSFFPHLITGPFGHGLHEAFDFAFIACLISAAASMLRGGKFIYQDDSMLAPDADDRQMMPVSAGPAIGRPLGAVQVPSVAASGEPLWGAVSAAHLQAAAEEGGRDV